MVKCTFCGNDLKPGTGKMLVLKDGKVQYFDRQKCEKNLVKLGRKARTTQWTASYALQKAANKAAGMHGKPKANAS